MTQIVTYTNYPALVYRHHAKATAFTMKIILSWHKLNAVIDMIAVDSEYYYLIF